MSIYNNQSRTLSGLTTFRADQLELPSSKRAISIKGQFGVAGDVLQKSSTNKLAWGKIDDIEIPDGSITGAKLATDITISTTGNISANDGKFNEIELPKTSVGAEINVELNSTGIYTLNNKIIKSGGVLEGKTLLINNGDSNSLPMVVMGNGSVIGTLKSTTFQLPTTGQADDWVVRLNSTGINTTKNITALGTITGDDGKFDEMEFPKTGSPDVEINDTGITTSAGTAINCGGNLSGKSLGITNGQGTAVAVVGGDVDVTRQFKSTRTGNATAPVPGATYTEFALNLSDAKGDAFIGRNLICGGTIYGNIEGTITEEHIDAQSLNIRTDPSGGGGATGISMTNGNINLVDNSITGNVSGFSISGNTGNISCESFTAGKNSGKTITIGANTFPTTYSNLATDIIVGSNQYNSETKIESRLNTFGRIESLPVVASVNKIMGASTTITAGGLDCILGGISISVKAGGNYEGSNTVTSPSSDYDTELKYVNMEGRYLSHQLTGTIQASKILSSTKSKVALAVPDKRGKVNSSTGYGEVAGFNFTGQIAQGNYVKLDFSIPYTYSGLVDLYVRIDTATGSAASAYTGSQSAPVLIHNFLNSTHNYNLATFSIFISGLTEGVSYAFYPKFGDTDTGSGVKNIMYGANNGNLEAHLTWLNDVTITDPISSDDDY